MLSIAWSVCRKPVIHLTGFLSLALIAIVARARYSGLGDPALVIGGACVLLTLAVGVSMVWKAWRFVARTGAVTSGSGRLPRHIVSQFVMCNDRSDTAGNSVGEVPVLAASPGIAQSPPEVVILWRVILGPHVAGDDPHESGILEIATPTASGLVELAHIALREPFCPGVHTVAHGDICGPTNPQRGPLRTWLFARALAAEGVSSYLDATGQLRPEVAGREINLPISVSSVGAASC